MSQAVACKLDSMSQKCGNQCIHQLPKLSTKVSDIASCVLLLHIVEIFILLVGGSNKSENWPASSQLFLHNTNRIQGNALCMTE